MKVTTRTSNKQNRSRAVANHVSKQKNKSRDDSGFVDNRPETKAIKSMQMMINESPRMAAQRQSKSNITAGTAQGVKGWDKFVPNGTAESTKFIRLYALSTIYNDSTTLSKSCFPVVQFYLDDDFMHGGEGTQEETKACKEFAEKVSGYVDQAHTELMTGNVKDWKGAKIYNFLTLLMARKAVALVHAGNAIEERVYSLMQGSMNLPWTPQYSKSMGGSSFPDIVINLESGKEALIDITSQRGHILGKAGGWTTCKKYIYVAEAYFPSIYKDQLPIIQKAIQAAGMTVEEIQKELQKLEVERGRKREERKTEIEEAHDIYRLYGNFTHFAREAFGGDRTEAAHWMHQYGMGDYRGVPKKKQKTGKSPETRRKKQREAVKARIGKMSTEERQERAKRTKRQQAEAAEKRRKEARRWKVETAGMSAAEKRLL